MKKKLNSLKRCVRTSHELAELKQQKSKRLILGLLRSTLTLWQCAAKVIYTTIQLYSPFGRIKIKYKNSQTGHIIKNTQNIDMHAH